MNSFLVSCWSDQMHGWNGYCSIQEAADQVVHICPIYLRSWSRGKDYIDYKMIKMKYVVVMIFFLLVLCLGCITMQAKAVGKTEALLLVKQFLGYPPSLSSWKASTDCCSGGLARHQLLRGTHFLNCLISGHSESSNNQLTGSLPSSLGQLRSLGLGIDWMRIIRMGSLSADCMHH